MFFVLVLFMLQLLIIAGIVSLVGLLWRSHSENKIISYVRIIIGVGLIVLAIGGLIFRLFIAYIGLILLNRGFRAVGRRPILSSVVHDYTTKLWAMWRH